MAIAFTKTAPKPVAPVVQTPAKPSRKGIGGRPKLDNAKVAISLRLDPAVIAKFKATGAGWQSRMNDVLALAHVPLSLGISGERWDSGGQFRISTPEIYPSNSYICAFSLLTYPNLSDRLVSSTRENADDQH